jgi:peptidoglycan/LPS O-acetylase OafA/YrhL
LKLILGRRAGKIILENKKNWIFEFDYLRVIAIFGVLTAHGYGIFGMQAHYPSLVPYMTFLGAVGVILFFFISGFLISKIVPETQRSIINSFKGRLIRIGPLFWIALLLTAILFSLNIYQGYWIKNFDLYNVFLNGLFLINFTPNYDIPPFWFVSALVLFNLTYLVLRYIFKNPFYFALSSLGVFFLFLTLEMAGKMWATNTFIYFLSGALLGIMYNAHVFTLDRIESVHPIISTISDSSYAIYLFHLIIFGAVAKILALFTITNFVMGFSIAIIVTICIGRLLQKLDERISACIRGHPVKFLRPLRPK